MQLRGSGEEVAAAVAAVRAAAGDFQPQLGVVLGSGLGDFAEALEDCTVISYGDLPGFPTAGVASHAGQLVLGTLEGVRLAVMQGRAHFYEHADARVMATPVRTMKALGAEGLVLTNAAGSCRRDMGPGSVMMITDHINFTGVSPLFGEEGNSRFVALADAYSSDYAARLRQVAQDQDIVLNEGTYAWYFGPNFETPAEIRALITLGSDAVGMSTVPEVILARHAGLKVMAMSNITNLAAGLSAEQLSHEHTMAKAGEGAAKITTLLRGFCAVMD